MSEGPPPEPVLDAADLAEFQKGIEEFNAGKFFECHDTLEEVWRGVRGPARDFFQGLIQISVGFYHLGNGNRRGAESQLTRALQNLQAYGDGYLGVELADLRGEVRTWVERIRSGANLGGTIADLPKYRYRAPV